VWDRRLERTRGETEPPAALDLEAAGRDGAHRVAGGVTAAGDTRPQRAAVEEGQDGPERLAFSVDVLVEAELAAGADDAP
jgi:hypothetical protein